MSVYVPLYPLPTNSACACTDAYTYVGMQNMLLCDVCAPTYPNGCHRDRFLPPPVASAHEITPVLISEREGEQVREKEKY